MPAHTIIYTNASTHTPYAKPEITITDGMQRCINVPLMSQGFVTKIVVKQSDATDAAYDVELLNSVVPFPVGEAVTGTAAADTIELYRIIPKQTKSAGQVLELFVTGLGYAYKNQDGSNTANQRYVYLVIIPADVNHDSDWVVSITVHDNSAGAA